MFYNIKYVIDFDLQKYILTCIYFTNRLRNKPDETNTKVSLRLNLKVPKLFGFFSSLRESLEKNLIYTGIKNYLHCDTKKKILTLKNRLVGLVLSITEHA